MKKALLIPCLALFGLSMATAAAFAQVEFTISAEIPAANGATFSVSRVFPGPPEVFVPVDTTDLDFLQLTLNTELGIFLPSFFWVIDIGSNGAGNPDVEFAYTDTANPNGTPNDGTGLGDHGTIAYAKVVTHDDSSQTVNLIRGESLDESTTSPDILETAIDGGFLRVTVGIATGDEALQEGTATPFTAADEAGTYSGILTITATFD